MAPVGGRERGSRLRPGRVRRRVCGAARGDRSRRCGTGASRTRRRGRSWPGCSGDRRRTGSIRCATATRSPPGARTHRRRSCRHATSSPRSRRSWNSPPTNRTGRWPPSCAGTSPEIVTKRPRRLRRLLESQKFVDAVRTEMERSSGDDAVLLAGPVREDVRKRTVSWNALSSWPAPNVWIGTSIEPDEYCWRAG